MFNYKHYVPILKWRAAEKGALEKLEPKHKTLITPLIEFIMPQPKYRKKEKRTPKDLLKESIDMFLEKLPNIPNEVLKYWGRSSIFIDVQLIDGSLRADSLKKILNLGQELDILMIPVINIIPVIGSDADIKTRQIAIQFAQKSKHGLCIRITDSNFNEVSLPNDIRGFITKNNLNIENTNLLIDFKAVDEQTDCDSLVNKINTIPSIEKWRTFVVAGGTFPKDLSQFEKHNQYEISRADWIIWKKLIKNLKRPPSFSDYTIQYPMHAPKLPIPPNISASIRYTLENSWLILRGEGLRNLKGAGFKQYPAQAQILAKQKAFMGYAFSFGDRYIAEKAKDIKTKKTGNPKTWLEAGINHHLVLVANQIASLP